MMYRVVFKRLFDIIFSLLAMIFLIPVYLLVGLLIKLDTKGSIIFKHARLGKNCKKIFVYKFRTMIFNADKIGPNYTKKDDFRVTRIGKILRKTSIDELPQILNVLKGEMSFCGPRPDAFTEIPNNIQKKRCEVLPGITGLAQINGRSLISRELKEKYDLEYIDTYSFMLDLKIIIKTINLILKKEGVN